jgi:hypothetical protein
MNTKLVMLVGVLSAVSPLAAFAQSADATYCSALTAKYQSYLNDTGKRGQDTPPVAVSTAMSKCQSDPASSIPVLEGALKDAKLSLPPRG